MPRPPCRWVAYEQVGFSGEQYILEKGVYRNCDDWGSGSSTLGSLQPVVQVCVWTVGVALEVGPGGKAGPDGKPRLLGRAGLGGRGHGGRGIEGVSSWRGPQASVITSWARLRRWEGLAVPRRGGGARRVGGLWNVAPRKGGTCSCWTAAQPQLF